jgi:small-conductance mechanosensitive channel
MRSGSTRYARRRRVRAFLAGLLLVAPRLCVAADAPAAGAPATTPPAAAVPAEIPAREIPARGEATVSALHEMRAVLADDGTIDRIAGELPALRSDLARRASNRISPESGLSVRDLRDIERSWLRAREQLSEWSAEVERRIAPVDKVIDRLQEMEDTWRVTAQSADREDLPPAVTSEIAAVRTSLADFGSSVRDERASLLTLGSEIGSLQAKVVDRLADIDAATANQRRDLLSADAPPLWLALTSSTQESETEPTWHRKLEQLRSFAKDERTRLATQMLAVSLIAVAGLWLRRHVRRWPEGDVARAVVHPLIDHPLSAALLVTIVPGIVIYRTDPLVVTEAWSLLLAIPLVRLLDDRLHGRARRLVLAPGVLLIAATARGLLPPHGFAMRLMLLAENVGTAAWLLWALPPRVETLTTAPRWLVVVSRLSLVAIATSLLANLTGRLSFALFLTQAFLGNVLLALGVSGAARVHEAFVAAALHSPRTLRLRSIGQHAKVIRRRAVRLIRFVAVLLWITGALQIYGLLAPVAHAIATALDARLEIGALSLSSKDVLVFGLTVWLSLEIARLVRALLENDVLALMDLPRGVPSAISAAANYVILLFGFFFAMSAAGLDLGRVTLLAGAFGVGIGFGLQNIVNNFVSGLILLFERPVRIGDIIEMAQMTGRVRRIGIRSSTIETPEGAEVIVPNASLISERLTNWTLSDNRRRIEIPLTVAYGSDAVAVLELLKRVAAGETEVLSDPPPEAQFMGLGDNGLNFVLNAWTYFDLGPPVRSRVVLALHTALAEAGIEIPFPQREVRLRSVDGTRDGARHDGTGGAHDRTVPRKPTSPA